MKNTFLNYKFLDNHNFVMLSVIINFMAFQVAGFWLAALLVVLNLFAFILLSRFLWWLKPYIPAEIRLALFMLLVVTVATIANILWFSDLQDGVPSLVALVLWFCVLYNEVFNNAGGLSRNLKQIIVFSAILVIIVVLAKLLQLLLVMVIGHFNAQLSWLLALILAATLIALTRFIVRIYRCS
ncbi:MAG: hypothetical protein FWE37_02125 [Spirochaetaceae bacterium]|nr:hypothetical protein [Spirochaetaceae bacterium]